MNSKIEEKLFAVVDATNSLDEKTKQELIGKCVNAFAPKGILESKTIRSGIIASITGCLAVVSELFVWLVMDGQPHTEIIVGGAIGIVTGINAIRGRVAADTPVDTSRLL